MMARTRIISSLLVLLLLAGVVTACDDPGTALAVAAVSARPDLSLRVIAQTPDGTVNTATLKPGQTYVFRSLAGGSFIVSAVVNDAYIQEMRQQRDKLLSELVEIDLLTPDQAAERRQVVSHQLNNLIEQMQQMAAFQGGATCPVESGATGHAEVTLDVFEDAPLRVTCQP